MKRILSLALAFAMLLTCTALTAASAESSDTLVVLPYMTSENLNPYAGFGIDKVVRTQLFNSLWQYDENGQGVACLAESWEDSEDGTSVTVHLRQDVTFSDGTPFNADAVVFTYGIAANSAALGYTTQSVISKVEKVDDFTVVLYKAAPYASVKEFCVEYLPIVSPTAYQADPEGFSTNPVGTGAYVLDQVRAGSYKLSVTCPDGLMFTRYSATGREMRSILTAEGRRTASKSITLEPGDLLEKQHVGLMREATIEGVAFLDANYNGVYDEGEATLAGVEVEVSKLNGDKVADVETGEDGVFRATSLRSGEYKVRVILPTGGYTFTATVDRDTAGNWFKARSGRRENTVDGVTVQTGETVQMQVGAILPGTISGVCYLVRLMQGVSYNVPIMTYHIGF